MSTSKAEKEKLQLIQEKSQQILSELLKDEDNKYCVDCDAKGPRWASYNIGVFLCIRCAGIHRNLGVHISRVKSVNLDSWSPEQVAYMQLMGNSKARAVYEANLPDNFKRPQVDSGLEAFVRAKYEQKKYIAKEWVQPAPPKPAFDIDEERKKEKEKKKIKLIKGQTNSAIIDVQTNPVPRPHSSPAGTAINAEKVLNNKNGSGLKLPSTDLLGLNTSLTSNTVSTTKDNKSDDDQFDAFDAFVSCPPISATTTNKTDNLVNIQKDTIKSNANKTSEEEDFFNQKAPEQAKLDKESILKLYESSNLNKPQNNLFNLTSSTSLQTVNIATSNAMINGFNPVVNQNTLISNNLFSGKPSTNVINNGFANFNNQSANLNQQPFLAFNQASTITNLTTNSAFPLNNNPFLIPTNSNTNGISSTLTPSALTNDLFSSANLSTTLESQLNGLNLNINNTKATQSDSIASFDWPTNDNNSTNVNGNNHVSVGQTLFSANFDNLNEKKLNNILPINNLLTSTTVSANPFLNSSTIASSQPLTNNLDFSSSFSTTSTNGLNKNNSNDNLDDWCNFNSVEITNKTTSNGLIADIWQ